MRTSLILTILSMTLPVTRKFSEKSIGKILGKTQCFPDNWGKGPIPNISFILG